MSATFEVSRECAAAKLSVLSAHLADSIAVDTTLYLSWFCQNDLHN